MASLNPIVVNKEQKQPGKGAAVARLMAMIPIALAKGGQPAVAGLLQGYQQGLLRKEQMGLQREQFDWQQQRDVMTNDRMVNEDARQEETARQQTEDRRLGMQQKFMEHVRSMGGNPELSPEEAMSQLEVLTRQAPQYGVSQVDVEQAAYVAPTRRERAKLEKDLAGVRKTVGDAKFENGEADALVLSDGMTVGQARQKVANVQGELPKRATAASGQQEWVKRNGQVVPIERGTAVAGDMPYDPVAARAGQGGGSNDGGLPPRQQTAVNSMMRAFDGLPIVKTVQKQAEAVSFADSLDINTKNPADDQALIYAFAKAMDPESVVREGEYATVQKYAQSWANNFGFNAQRIFSNVAFLTPQARANMKATIRSKYNSGKSQYDNVRRSYEAKINKITGRGDGGDYLTDYGGGFPADKPATAQPAPQGAAPSATSRSYQDYLRSKGQ